MVCSQSPNSRPQRARRRTSWVCTQSWLWGLRSFPSGHRLHNVFGLLQTFPFVGAPLAVALGWRGQGAVAAVSWVALVLLIAAMALNLSPLFSPRLAKALEPVYGLAQRSIFIAWYGWFAVLGVLLLVRS